jgi:hypothetical protein
VVSSGISIVASGFEQVVYTHRLGCDLISATGANNLTGVFWQRIAGNRTSNHEKWAIPLPGPEPTECRRSDRFKHKLAPSSPSMRGKQEFLPNRVRNELAPVPLINEPVEIGANLLRKRNVSARCAHV